MTDTITISDAEVCRLRRIEGSHADLLAAVKAIYGKAMPKADYAGGKATHYLVPKALVDAARTAIAKAEGTS